MWQFYNDSVYRYNTKIQSVPSNVIANQFSFDEREYFEVDEASRGNIQVDFGTAPAVDLDVAPPAAAPAEPPAVRRRRPPLPPPPDEASLTPRGP